MNNGKSIKYNFFIDFTHSRPRVGGESGNLFFKSLNKEPLIFCVLQIKFCIGKQGNYFISELTYKFPIIPTSMPACV